MSIHKIDTCHHMVDHEAGTYCDKPATHTVDICGEVVGWFCEPHAIEVNREYDEDCDFAPSDDDPNRCAKCDQPKGTH